MKALLSALILLTLLVPVRAQICADPVKIISYDTILHGSGNAGYSVTFPKFDPAQGTLMEILIETKITLKYSFQLENREVIPISTYRVRVTREDELSGPSLSVPIYNSYTKQYGMYTLGASDGTPGSGPDFIAVGPMFVMNRVTLANTYYNTADYLGIGNVTFDHLTTTYSSVLGSVNYNFNGTAEDTVEIKLSYLYCPTWFLQANLAGFQASVINNNKVQLEWNSLNEMEGGQYEVEMSRDGRNYKAIAQMKNHPDALGNGSYQLTYPLQANELNQALLFRIRQIEKNGSIRYSGVKVIDLRKKEENNGKIIPNPATTFAQIIFNNMERGNWQVDIYNANGLRLQQYQFSNALSGRLDRIGNLPKGVYFIKAIESRTQQQLQQTLYRQ